MIFEPSWTVASADGSVIAAYELGGTGEPLLIAHATGFCGTMYSGLADELTDTFRVVAFDFRGHGNSAAGKHIDLSWDRMAEDILAVVNHLGDTKLAGFGHSMGGGTLALAEHLRPGTFQSLFLYEPIMFPSEFPKEGQNSMAAAARRRRATFGSRPEVLARYAARPPLSHLRARFLLDYIDNGFAEVPEGVTLKCSPENEARIFEEGRALQISRLTTMMAPTVVAVGQPHEGPDPALLGPYAAKGLGNATLRRYDHLDHFGPFEDPWTISRDIRAHAAACSRS